MSWQQTQPYNFSKAITKSDTVNIDGTVLSTGATALYQTTTNTKPIPCDAIYSGGAGDIIVIYEGGYSATFTVVAGEILPVRAIRVGNSTTVTGVMNALYTI